MVGAASAAASTASTATEIMDSNNSASAGDVTAQSFNCSLCIVSLQDNTQQRLHMKSPWHVYNLKRRMASLPAIDEKTFKAKVQVETVKDNMPAGDECSTCQQVYDTTKKYQTHLKSRNHLQRLAAADPEEVEVVGNDVQYLASVASQIENLKIDDSNEEDEEDDDDDDENGDTEHLDDFDPEVCLFCLLDSGGLDENMTHMQKAHSLFIPDQDNLTHLESFLAYLTTLITHFHECLYCGCTRSSAEGARAHMISKGHCMINLDSGELREFWDDSSERLKGVLENEGGDEKMALPGGKVIGRRDLVKRYQHRPSIRIRAARRAIAATEMDLQAESTPSENPDRRLVTRVPNSEMGLVGLTDVEKRSLRAVEKKMMKIEMRARNEYQSHVEQGANRQRHFKVRKSRTLILPPGLGSI